MDASRDVIESSKPPKPPRPGRASEPGDGDPRTSLLAQVVALCAVAAAVFTGITAWETHQERVNTEVIYCTFMISSADTEAPQRTEADAADGGPARL